MPLEPDFLELMTETVIIETRLSSDEYGKDMFGIPVVSRARIERKPSMVRDTEGRERVSGTSVFLFEPLPLESSIRVTLPDGSQPEVLSVEQSRDTDGLVYYSAILL